MVVKGCSNHCIFYFDLRREMDFDLPPTFPASGIAWERVLPPLLPALNGTFGLYSFTPSELLTPVTEHTGSAQVGLFPLHCMHAVL